MNPQYSILFHLGYLAKIMNRRANALFHKSGYNVRMEQIPVLMALRFYGRLSQQELADKLDRDKSSIQRTVVTLARNGLINIGADKLDKRKNIIALNDCGQCLAKEMEQNMSEVEGLLFDHLSDNAKNRLISMIAELGNYTIADD